MLTQQENYHTSESYEALMMRAYQSGLNFDKGIDRSYFVALYDIAHSFSQAGMLYTSQLKRVKYNLWLATKRISRWELNNTERAMLKKWTVCILEATTEEALRNAIAGLLDVTQRFPSLSEVYNTEDTQWQIVNIN